MQDPVLLVYTVEPGKQLFFTKKARTESNWKTKHPFIFVLIILRAAFVMIVTHGRFRTCLQLERFSFQIGVFHLLIVYVQICLCTTIMAIPVMGEYKIS